VGIGRATGEVIDECPEEAVKPRRVAESSNIGFDAWVEVKTGKSTNGKPGVSEP
jgi:hypothetical protein